MKAQTVLFVLGLAIAGSSIEKARAQTSPAVASQQPKSVVDSLGGQAQRDFIDGLTLFDAGRHQEALTKFSRAYEASQEPRILYNMGSCHEKMKQYAKARALLRKCKKDAGAAKLITLQQRAEIDKFLQSSEAFVGRIHLEAEPPGAVIRIDQAPVGTTPLLEPLEADEGPHELRLTKPGFREWSASVAVQGRGAVVKVSAILEPAVPEGRLIVRTSPTTATIRLDGTEVGAGTLEQAVPSGRHHLTISAQGKRTRELDVDIAEDETRRLDVTLEAEGGSHVWLWVVGGAALLAGAATVGVVLATRRDETTAPNAPHGTTMLPLGVGF